MILPAMFSLRLLTTLADVELGPRWRATEVATGHVAYSFEKMTRRQIVAFLERGGGTVEGTRR